MYSVCSVCVHIPMSIISLYNHIELYVYTLWVHIQCRVSMGGGVGLHSNVCTHTYTNTIYTVEPLYCRHPWDRKVSLIERCPHFRGQNVHTILMFETAKAVSIRELPYLRDVLISGVPLFEEGPFLRGVIIDGFHCTSLYTCTHMN